MGGVIEDLAGNAIGEPVRLVLPDGSPADGGKGEEEMRVQAERMAAQMEANKRGMIRHALRTLPRNQLAMCIATAIYYPRSK